MDARLYHTLRQWLNGYSLLLIYGLGEVLRGDDALGIYIAESLKRKSLPKTLIHSGKTPEELFELVEELSPSHLLIIDAIHSNTLMEGEILFLKEVSEISTSTFSTHTIPLSQILKLLTEIHPVKTAVIGVTASTSEIGTEISQKVKNSSNILLSTIVEVLESFRGRGRTAGEHPL